MLKTTVKYPFLSKEVEVYTRENGHKIVLAHKEGGLVNISTWVKTGSINEIDSNNGISHFLEHLMFKGTNKHKAGEFDRILESRGGIVNAATWKDYTFYYVTIPKGDNNENFKIALDLHSDMMLDPLLPKDEIGEPFDINDKDIGVKKERHVVIEEIRMREDQPWTKVYNAANRAMYTSHPYRRDVIGTPQIISQVSQEEIKNYYNSYYCPQNMTTIIVGDFEHEIVLNKIVELFDFKDRVNVDGYNGAIDKPSNETKYIENRACINSAFLIVGFLGVPAKDIRSTILLDMLSIVLGEGASSRLYKNLIEQSKDHIFNIVDSEHYVFKDGGNFFIQANFNPDKKDDAIKDIKNEIAKLSDISEEELSKAKKKIKSRFASNAETVSEIGETIGYYMTVCDDLSLVSDYLDIVDKVSVEDLENTANRYLNINNAVVSVLMPE